MSFVFAPPQQAVVPVQNETYSYFPIRRVFGIARNYAEPGAATKDTPFYFMKDCYTVVPVADGECARIPMPPQSQVLKHEIELVACLGKGGRNLTLEATYSKPSAELINLWNHQVEMSTQYTTRSCRRAPPTSRAPSPSSAPRP